VTVDSLKDLVAVTLHLDFLLTTTCGHRRRTSAVTASRSVKKFQVITVEAGWLARQVLYSELQGIHTIKTCDLASSAAEVDNAKFLVRSWGNNVLLRSKHCVANVPGPR